MGGAMKRLAPNLRVAGVNVTWPKRTDKKARRLIRLEKLRNLMSERSERQKPAETANNHQVVSANDDF